MLNAGDHDQFLVGQMAMDNRGGKADIGIGSASDKSKFGITRVGLMNLIPRPPPPAPRGHGKGKRAPPPPPPRKHGKSHGHGRKAPPPPPPPPAPKDGGSIFSNEHGKRNVDIK